jgi:hypothetical protein
LLEDRDIPVHCASRVAITPVSKKRVDKTSS